MRRALGEGPEALALVLAGIWLAAVVALPLEHALVHADSEVGHCHSDGGALVCHGGASSERSDGPAISDASLTDLGDLSLCHGAVAMLATPPLAVLPPVQTLLTITTPATLESQASTRHRGMAKVRGPPGTTLLG
jgi:hypothetical protein